MLTALGECLLLWEAAFAVARVFEIIWWLEGAGGARCPLSVGGNAVKINRLSTISQCKD